MPRDTLRPGMLIANGATIVAVSTRYGHEYVLLCLTPNSHMENNHDPYATWKCERPGDGSGTHSGHYHQSLKDAVDDFFNR